MSSASSHAKTTLSTKTKRRNQVHRFAPQPRIPRPLGLQPLAMHYTPMTARRTLRYSDYQALAGTGGALGIWVFRANSVYDPDVSFGGHQPMGFDQLTPLYTYWTVLSARITIDVIAVSVPVFAGLALSSGFSASYSTYNSYIESGLATYRILEDPTPGRNRITLTCVTSEFFGITDPMDSDALRGTAASDPTQTFFIHVLAQDVNKTSTCNAEINVVIDYDIIFHSPKVLTTS